MKEVETRIVKEQFVLDDVFGKKIVETSAGFSGKQLEEAYNRANTKVQTMTIDELDREITDKKRLERYDQRDWYEVNEVPLKDIGSWPKMRELPIEATIWNFIYAADFVRENEELVPEDLQNSLDQLHRFSQKLDFARKNTRIILFEGPEVRETEYNVWARNEGEPEVKIFPYTADNGNLRALASAIAGFGDINAYLGMLPKKVDRAA